MTANFRGRRVDSRGPYTIHVLNPAGAGARSACLAVHGLQDEFCREEPTPRHPLCRRCQTATPSIPRPVRPRPAPPPPTPVPPTRRPDELAHRMIWASHAFASAARLALLDLLGRRGRMKSDDLRDAADQWQGMYDLSLDALVRGRVVRIEGKYVELTPFGRRLFDLFEASCAAGDVAEPAATH